MTSSDDLETLPAMLAMEGQSVLAGERRGTSVQLDENYFTGRVRAHSQFADGEESEGDPRAEAVRDSWETYDAIEVEVESVSVDALTDASERFRAQLQEVPEVTALVEDFPGRAYVVPEWMKTGRRLQYGARVYFFRDEDAPSPETVVAENVEAIVEDDFRSFERYQGRLHGYPECCIDFYGDRSPTKPSPEWRALEPFGDRIDLTAVGAGVDGSIDEVVTGYDDACYAVFAREFFPDPGCETARERGRALYEFMADARPERLADDYFSVVLAANYLVALNVHTGEYRRPSPGALGREHLLQYLPLSDVLAVPRYAP